VLNIGTVVNGTPLFFGNQVAGLGEIVEFNADRIGRFPEFLRHLPQIGRSAAVGKELQQHLDTGLGSDQGVKHGVNLRENSV